MISDTDIMALLTRYLQLNDSEDTHVFNFIVTKSVTRDSSKDVVSKDFAYGSHRWAISFSKHDKVILKYGKNVSIYFVASNFEEKPAKCSMNFLKWKLWFICAFEMQKPSILGPWSVSDLAKSLRRYERTSEPLCYSAEQRVFRG